MAKRAKHYWVMKSEPGTYSIKDLEKDGSTSWDGVRNYRARNYMRDDMKVGDLVLFHHSSAKPPGVAGVATVSKEAYPDHTAFDAEGKYFDPKSDPDNPRWQMVDVSFVELFADVVSMDALKAEPKLTDMPLIMKGQRLSVMPITKAHFETVRKMGRAKK